jgi:hypothetical protein
MMLADHAPRGRARDVGAVAVAIVVAHAGQDAIAEQVVGALNPRVDNVHVRARGVKLPGQGSGRGRHPW